MTQPGRRNRQGIPHGGSPASSASGLSIGTVLAQLRSDFPDVTISKIRFLESEGLVRPARAASGYRQFSARDVERLRFILAAQRDRYLPLKVIKQQLEGMDFGAGDYPPPMLVAVADAPVHVEVPAGLPEPADFGVGPETPVSRAELLAAAGINGDVLVELEQYGLVRPSASGFYDPDAIDIAKTVRAMTDFGLEPRHLRAFRASADREVGLLAQIVTPLARQRDPDARARADEVARQLAALSVALHARLVKAGLRSATGG